MKQKQFIGLGALALALLALALWLGESRKPSQQAAEEGPLVPGLEDRLNTLERIRVQPAGGEAITLERIEDTWIVADKQGYPADLSKLRDLLLGLAQARRVEPKTAVAMSYPVLGVQDIDAEGASNVQVSLEGAGQTVAVILGQNNPRGDGTYVRLKGEAQSWLVDRNLAAEKSLSGWLKRDLIDIAGNRIAEVEVQPPQGDEIRIEANPGGEGDFRIANLPAGREAASAYVADATANLLSGLRIDDVQPAAAYSHAEDAPLTRAKFATREGLNIELEARGRGEDTWAQFSIGLDEEVARARIEGEQAREAMAWEASQKQESEANSEGASAEAADIPVADAASAATNIGDGEATDAESMPPAAISDPEGDLQDRLQALRDERERLHRAVEGWVFKLPAFKADNLQRGMDAYLKPKG
jgi:hypothetical protein